MLRKSLLGLVNSNYCSQRISVQNFSTNSSIFSKFKKPCCNINLTNQRFYRTSSPVMKKDFYKVLGVTKHATKDEIKRNYRELAKKYHPDLNKEANAESKFKEVAEAHEILENDQKRKLYDSYGHDGVDPSFEQYDSSPGGFGGFGGFDGVQYVDMDDFFDFEEVDMSNRSKSGKKKKKHAQQSSAGHSFYTQNGVDMEEILQMMMEMEMNQQGGKSKRGSKRGGGGGGFSRNNMRFDNDDFFVEFNMGGGGGGFNPFGGGGSGGGGGGGGNRGKGKAKPSTRSKKPSGGGGSGGRKY